VVEGSLAKNAGNQITLFKRIFPGIVCHKNGANDDIRAVPISDWA
jgi:hypothetical protein